MQRLTNKVTKIRTLKLIPVFSDLNWLELRSVARKSSIIKAKKGDIICREGNPPDAFYCLISGRLQAYSLNREGEKFDVEFIRRGMYFGIVPLLTEENYTQTYKVMNDSLILKIEKDDFHKILRSIPHLGIEFSHSLSKRIQRKITPNTVAYESTVISIYSPVQGVGNSTYAINLALNLEKESRKKVILVHIDHLHLVKEEQPHIHVARPKWKMGAQLNTVIDEPQILQDSIIKGKLAIDLLNVDFDTEDISLVEHISQLVADLVNNYDYVVVDLPNKMDNVVLKTLVQSDIIQIITINEQDVLNMTRDVIYKLEEELKENFDQEKIQVLISGTKNELYLTYEEVNKVIDYDVLMKLPHIDSQGLNEAIVSDEMSVYLPDPSTEYAQEIRKMARRISGVMVGLVLGGGAALGMAHIGVLRVLEEEHVPIDMVVGSSMGAVIAGIWSTGTTIDELESLARQFKSLKSMMRIIDFAIPPISALVKGQAIKNWLKRSGLGNKTFYATRIPLKVVAYDLIKRKEIILDSGSIVDAIRKSIAIPGVIEPVLEEDKVIIDGGVLNPLPTNVLVRMGVSKIIAVNVLQSPEDVTKGFIAEQNKLKEKSKIPFLKSPFEYIGFRIGKVLRYLFTPNISDIIVRSLQASEYLFSEESAKKANVLITPNLEGINWFELYKVDDLIKRGEEATRQALHQIKYLINS